MQQLTGRTPGAVLVTGSARRLGRHTADTIAARGVPVVFHANGNAAEALEAAAAVVRAGGSAASVTCDLQDPEQVPGLIARARDAIGQPLTGLVNNASLFERDGLEDFSVASWQAHMAVNLLAPSILAQSFAAQLPDGATGAIVNVIDMRVFKLTPDFYSYTLSKAGLATATRTMAQALAPRIRVNGVAPGPTARNSRQAEEDFRKQVDATILGTGSPPECVTAAIAFLLDAPAITGQVLAVDGGQSLVWQTPDVVGLSE
jgi:NAD(P)-dependent dehydrogenase (short-subunit alcohol dehydrogenase family)